MARTNRKTYVVRKRLYAPVDGFAPRVYTAADRGQRGYGGDPKRATYIAEQVANGRTYQDVAKELGISRQRVMQILVATGAWQRRHFPPTEREFQMIEELYPRAPWEQILAAFPGRTKHSIQEFASWLGVRRLQQYHSRQVFTPERMALIRKMRQEGKDYGEISATLGIPRHTLAVNVVRIAPELRMRLRGPKKTPEERAEIIAAEGTQNEIARRYGITQGWVSALKRRNRA